MKYDFDHWDKTEMTREEALAWFESELEVTDGERCFQTCPQCQANKWAAEALSVRWHKYPDEKPPEPGKYLVEIPLDTIPVYYSMEVVDWGKSSECEWKDKKLRRKKGYWYNYDSEWGDYEVTRVIAWMPLPKPMPMKEEKTDDNTQN